MIAIRKHYKDFLAVIGLILIAGAVSVYILGNQRLRFPIVQDKPFVLKAEFQTAQAVIAGQGQTVRVSGVRIGDIGAVELKDGRAIVRMDIDQKYKDMVHTDATALLRPKTGLKDMFIQLEPGTRRRARRQGELDDPGRLDDARRQPGRDPLLAGRRHARLPAAADLRPRPGPRRAAAATCATCSAASSRRTATSPPSTARSPSGARTCGA